MGVYPTIHGETGMYLTVVAQNYGPSAASDVLIFIRLRDSAGNALPETERRMREPEWAPGRTRTFMPHRSDKFEALNALADDDLILELEWEWSDGRRRFWRIGSGPFVRQTRKATHALRQFRDDMYGGQALVEADPMKALPKIHDDLKGIKGSIDRLRTGVEKARRDE